MTYQIPNFTPLDNDVLTNWIVWKEIYKDETQRTTPSISTRTTFVDKRWLSHTTSSSTSHLQVETESKHDRSIRLKKALKDTFGSIPDFPDVTKDRHYGEREISL